MLIDLRRLPNTQIRDYHCAVMASPHAHAFDSDWLDELASLCGQQRAAGATFVDLFLGRRLEITVSNASGTLQVESSRSEGSAVRWSHPTRLVLRSCAGIAPEAVSGLLPLDDNHTWQSNLLHPRSDDLSAPPEWMDWASELCETYRPRRTTVRLIVSDAVAVLPGKWTPVRTPPLLRVELVDSPRTALLAVWGNPKIGVWLGELAEPAPTRPWQPSSGTELSVVFANGTFGVLMHELVGHMLELDQETDRNSPFRDLHGALVSAPTLSMVDDPGRWDLPGAFSADDEGIPASAQDLLTEGRVVGTLCDRVSATRYGLTPGRGRRTSWTSHPQPRMSNLVVSPGQTPPEDLEGGQRRGIVVTRLAGAIADPISQRVVVRVERGYELHNGRRRRPLAEFELTGSVLQLLADIDPVFGNDPCADWRLGWCIKDGAALPTGSSSPSALVHRLRVL